MSRFNCNDCCLNDTESCRYGANKSKDYSKSCPDLLVEQNVAYEKALDDFRKRINDFLIDSYYFADFVVKDGTIDWVIDELKKGKEE